MKEDIWKIIELALQARKKGLHEDQINWLMGKPYYYCDLFEYLCSV